MKRGALALLLVFLLAGFIYFYRTSPPTLPPPASFGGVSLTLEYATTSSERELGLGGRSGLADDHAMLFVFSTPDRYGFWMKDTLIPLDMFWLDDQGRVVWKEENVATSTYPTVFYPPVPVRYVLETNAGFAKAHGVATGTPLILQSWP